MMNKWLISLVALLWVAPLSAEQAQLSDKATRAAPAVTTISGTPLTINIGSDNSYQVFNSDIAPGMSGAVGQFYPSNSQANQTADAGWFVDVGGVLYAPNFGEHPAGSATGSLGGRDPYTETSLSTVSGSGTSASPFVVEVVSQLGSTGLSVIKTTEYVNGESYYIERFRLINLGAGTQQAAVFYGGDIFLASSDKGVPYREPISNSPGGQTCPGAGNPYNILLIPLTPATHSTAKQYADVWTQIGDGLLDDGTATGCIDNGAALQWNVTLPPSSSRFIQAATSFGDIPPIATFNVTNVDPFQGSIGTELDITISGYGFLPATRFDFGTGVTVLNLSVPNTNNAIARLQIAQNAPIGYRDVIATQVPGGLSATLIRGFVVGDAPVWNYTINGLNNVNQAAVTCVRTKFPANPSTNAQGWAPSEGEFYHEDPTGPFLPPATPNGLARAVLDCFLSPSAWNSNTGYLYEQYCWDVDSPRYIGEYPDIREMDLRIHFSLPDPDPPYAFSCNGPPPGTPVFQQNVNIIRQLFSPLPMVRSGFELP